MTSKPTNIEADILVVGGGFGGCYALHKLRKTGLNVKLLEAGSDFGGVWHWNRYPGARVDSEYFMYQYSSHDVWRRWDWKERFPGDIELRAYFDHVAKVLDLRKDAIFNATVAKVTYNDETKKWTCELENGRLATCKYLVLATGSSHKKNFPQIPSISSYNGRLIHSAAYPEDLDVKGKRVGLIGQGASGIQILQELAKKDCELKVYIRTPSFACPMMQRKIAPDESTAMKGLYQAVFERTKAAPATESTNQPEHAFGDLSEEEREELYEETYVRGGFAFLGSTFKDLVLNKEANMEAYKWWVKKTRARMTDPVKMDIVAPWKQANWLGTKRPSLEQDYYEMIDRPNVELIDLKKTPIQAFTNRGIITGAGGNSSADRFDELDIVICATGYDALTGSLYDMNIHDKNGVRLQDKWKDGVKTHLGMMIPDMPNLFLVYGPQAPTSLANGPPFVEKQGDWIVDFIEKMRKESVEYVEPTEEAASRWRETVHAVSNATLFHETASWYFGSNVPGKLQEPLVFFGGVPYWDQCCAESTQSWKDYKTINGTEQSVVG